MTGRMVERAASAAYRSAPVRSGLRVLVIGGLAGAAWLLTGAAAPTADLDPAAGGSSLDTSQIGSVVQGDDHGTPVLDGFPKAAAQPLAPVPHPVSSNDADVAPSEIIDVVRELPASLRPAGVAVDIPGPVPVREVRRHDAEPPTVSPD